MYLHSFTQQIFFESLPIPGVGAAQSMSAEGMNEWARGCYPEDAVLLGDKLSDD